MRIRSIKPEFFKDDELASLPPLARLLFVGLWGLADGEGRLEDRPVRIGVEVLPYDKADTDALLDALHEHGFITRYTVDGRGYIEVRSFRRHQRIGGKEAMAASEFPSPCDGEAVVKQLGSNGEAVGKRPMCGKERNGKERKVKGMGSGGVFTPPSEGDWVAYVRETFPDWPMPDALSAHGWYESKGWPGVKDWKGCAKTCYHRWQGKAQPRPIERQRALVGSHREAQPEQERTDPMPDWMLEVRRRLRAREYVSNAAVLAMDEWLRGGNPLPPDPDAQDEEGAA
jgi:hypothetical protein